MSARLFICCNKTCSVQRTRDRAPRARARLRSVHGLRDVEQADAHPTGACQHRAPLHGDLDGLPDLLGLEHIKQILGALDGSAVDFGDDVAWPRRVPSVSPGNCMAHGARVRKLRSHVHARACAPCAHLALFGRCVCLGRCLASQLARRPSREARS